MLRTPPNPLKEGELTALPLKEGELTALPLKEGEFMQDIIW